MMMLTACSSRRRRASTPSWRARPRSRSTSTPLRRCPHVNLHLERMADYGATIAKITGAERRPPPARGSRSTASGYPAGALEEVTRVALDLVRGPRPRRPQPLDLHLDQLDPDANRWICRERARDRQPPWLAGAGRDDDVVSRCFERIGDHAVDIGEQTYYYVTRTASSPTRRTLRERLRLGSTLRAMDFELTPTSARFRPSPARSPRRRSSRRGRVGPRASLPRRALREARRARSDGCLRARGVRRGRRGLPLVHPRARGALARDAGVGVTVAVHTSAVTLPILAFGSDEQRARFVPPLARGEALGAFALTEPESGSDAGSLADRGDGRRRRLEAQRLEAVDHERLARGNVPRSSRAPIRRRRARAASRPSSSTRTTCG